ncbi:MAG: NAD(P)H-dependent oxidoreductase [Bdellovibrionales bacterium]|nr:NAD(P)H-dependent oxidoreductase [Bdellovibrionales bacterium]
MKVFIFGAALRKDSLNQELARQAARILGEVSGISVDLAAFSEFPMPVYDGDLEESSGMPEGAEKLAARIAAADAIVISAPEYNGSISGALKNAIDWVSRSDNNPFDGRPLLLMGASPGALGAVRGLWHTRVPFEAMGSLVYPELFGLPRAHQAFADIGFADAKTESRLKELLQDFSKFALKLKN